MKNIFINMNYPNYNSKKEKIDEVLEDLEELCFCFRDEFKFTSENCIYPRLIVFAQKPGSPYN